MRRVINRCFLKVICAGSLVSFVAQPTKAQDCGESLNSPVSPPKAEAYPPDFYALYFAYLIEPRVRRQHDRVLQILKTDPDFNSVADLGCGQAQEFFHYARPRGYVGLDLNVSSSEAGEKTLVQGDYRDLDRVVSLIERHRSTAVVSLFSAEITRPASENQAFYEEIFRRTRIRAMMVSGFYYSDRKDTNPVRENGDVLSYQTLEAPEKQVSPVFNEMRIILPVPSSLFGPSVFEVWRILKRNEG